MLYAQFFLIVFPYYTRVTLAEDEVLQFKVGMPEYICDKTEGIKNINSDTTTIRFLGKDHEAMEYKFDVNFERVGKKCANNQRCTLMVWQAVRELDQYLRNYPASDIKNGIIQINNTMLQPGIKYILNVTIMKEGRMVKNQQLTMDYVDEEMKKNAPKPMASLTILGPQTSYAFNSVTMNTESSICANITSFNYHWKILDDQNRTLVDFAEKGTELTIPENTFRAPKKYTICCSLINSEDGTVLVTQTEQITILSKGIRLNLSVISLTTRINQPVRIRAFLRDLDNQNGDFELKWSCEDLTNSEECSYNSDSSTELEMDSGFSKIGKYKISLEASKGAFTETRSCFVHVEENVPLMEVDETEYPINPSSGIAIRASIYKLKTFCTVQWTAPDEPNYEKIDLTKIPGEVSKLVNITTKEDLFLHELEEYSNDTVDKSHDLVIPPPSKEWEGLQGDTKYLFRLLVQCPRGGDEDIEAKTSVSTTIDIIIATNAAPKVGKFEVMPAQGVAYTTFFTFKVEKAEDKDEPITYKFGFVSKGKDVYLATLTEVTNCRVTLPLIKESVGIETFVEVCDCFGSCARVSGPTVQTTLPSSLDENYKNQVIDGFLVRMKNEEYYKAFSHAVSIIELKEEFPGAFDLISGKIDNEIDKFLAMDDQETAWKAPANNLIRCINRINSDLQLKEATLNKLIELRNKVSNAAENVVQSRKLLSFGFVRDKRENFLTLDDAKSFIEVSELIITTSKDSARINIEKENLRQQLANYMTKLCATLHQKPQVMQLKLKTLSLSVEKLSKSSLNSFQAIPFNNWKNGSAKIKLGNPFNKSFHATKMCIGKAVLRDYFGKSGDFYMAEILNANRSEFNEINQVLVVLPIDVNVDSAPKCMVFDNQAFHACETLQIGKLIKCACKQLGFYQ